MCTPAPPKVNAPAPPPAPPETAPKAPVYQDTGNKAATKKASTGRDSLRIALNLPQNTGVNA